jgi:hypothetical protein
MHARLAKGGIHHGSAQKRIEKEEQGPEGDRQAALGVRYKITGQERSGEEARRTHEGAQNQRKVPHDSQDIGPALHVGKEGYLDGAWYAQPRREGRIQRGRSGVWCCRRRNRRGSAIVRRRPFAHIGEQARWTFRTRRRWRFRQFWATGYL